MPMLHLLFLLSGGDLYDPLRYAEMSTEKDAVRGPHRIFKGGLTSPTKLDGDNRSC